MKVLTLHQPWASLVAIGAKTVETRSWSTDYRGPLAIHAAQRHPPVVVHGVGLTGAVGGGDPHHAMDMRDGRRVRLPLGAILATCRLVDVVPIIEDDDRRDVYPCVRSGLGTDDFPDGIIDIYHPTLGSHLDPRNDGRTDIGNPPLGDFAPGRYAWLLADIEPLPEPVPFKGGQRLTRKWAGGGVT